MLSCYSINFLSKIKLDIICFLLMIEHNNRGYFTEESYRTPCENHFYPRISACAFAENKKSFTAKLKPFTEDLTFKTGCGDMHKKRRFPVEKDKGRGTEREVRKVQLCHKYCITTFFCLSRLQTTCIHLSINEKSGLNGIG